MSHILICEDDESILEVLQMILEEQGHSVTAWGYCNDVETIRNVKPDLILADLWFPELGGAELCRLLKADDKLKKIPVLLVSATSELDKTAKKVGADGFIRKPFNVKDITQKVSAFL